MTWTPGDDFRAISAYEPVVCMVEGTAYLVASDMKMMLAVQREDDVFDKSQRLERYLKVEPPRAWTLNTHRATLATWAGDPCWYCARCSGTGFEDVEVFAACERCKGTGKHEAQCDMGHWHDKPCRDCDATGNSDRSEWTKTPCGSCIEGLSLGQSLAYRVGRIRGQAVDRRMLARLLEIAPPCDYVCVWAVEQEGLTPTVHMRGPGWHAALACMDVHPSEVKTASFEDSLA